MSKKIRYARIIGQSRGDTHADAVHSAKCHMIGSALGTKVVDVNEYVIEAVSAVRCENSGGIWWDAIMVGKYPLRKEKEII